MIFYIWYQLTFILQVPYKSYYISTNIFVAGGEQNIFISVITHFCRGEKDNIFSAGGGKDIRGGHAHTKRRHQKRGRMLEPISMKTFVMIKFIWSSTLDESRVRHDQDVPRRVVV